MARITVVGAGIVGLATAARLTARGDEVTVLEKEPTVAAHQTGRNSGVVHSGLYYAPGSLKARMAVAGNASMVAFAREHGVGHDVCGKLVVATSSAEADRLRTLAERGAANGIEAVPVSPDEARAIEPRVRAVAALRVPSTGIIDYVRVCEVLAAQVRAGGGSVRFGRSLVGARTVPEGVSVRHGDASRPGGAGGSGDARDVEDTVADALVVCGGLQADRLARACGVDPGARIVPFRGEYFTLRGESAGAVRGLVYPVPDPRFPFLGVHLTTTLDGGVHAGPNAVLALAREGYRATDVSPRDVADELGWPGLWRLGAKNLVPGAQEVLRSMSRRRFAASLARLVPGVTAHDLVPAPAGVRAQALARDGRLVDDFLVRTAPRQVHVINAPSPAATAALEIATYLVSQVDAVLS